jgi:acetyl/propionyl-CoA carboxylase alpha subunit
MAASPPFRRVLVANRGEIAVRVCRGLAELGIEPVAVYSDVDRAAAHVLAAPVACALGGSAASESYLCIDKILGAARDSGCDAVHPGYGFLSENADFADAVAAAGLVFLGPTAESMRQLGSKQRAREAAEAAGVPVVPGFHDDSGDDAALAAAARHIGFPLLLKASAGGGGKGMRVVERQEDFAEALAAGRREARAAFGDDRMLLEKLVLPARHVEIQVFGDQHGQVVSLHERECSVQRRHQKVLEEAPSPAVGPKLRQRMGEAAVRLAALARYSNAGTVEFLLDESGAFYFLEVNTRLQVEHPVTELVTGLDLVHLQVQVAAGAKLSDLLGGRDLAPRGCAIEARLYAESPEAGYLPASGTLRHAIEPEGPGIRVDSGVFAGAVVSPHYDPLLAKLIVHAPDRASACRRLARALAEVVYLGIPTNVDFLQRVVDDPDFRAGALCTDFLARKPELAAPRHELPPDAAYVAAMVALEMAQGAAARHGADAGAAGGAGRLQPWSTLGRFRVWEEA